MIRYFIGVIIKVPVEPFQDFRVFELTKRRYWTWARFLWTTDLAPPKTTIKGVDQVQNLDQGGLHAWWRNYSYQYLFEFEKETVRRAEIGPNKATVKFEKIISQNKESQLEIVYEWNSRILPDDCVGWTQPEKYQYPSE